MTRRKEIEASKRILAGKVAERKSSSKNIVRFTAIVERCMDTGLYVGYIPGFNGAHSQGETLDELKQNLEEVIGILLEDGMPIMDTEFIGTQQIVVA